MATLKSGDTGQQVADAKKTINKLFPEATPLFGITFDFNMMLRVMSMQSKLNQPQTGILTDELLADFTKFVRTSDAFVAPLDAGDVVHPDTIAAAREAIYQKAKAELDAYGFERGSTRPKFLGERIIAGARSEGKYRQGGVHLSTIYQIGGMNSGGCMVLSDAGKKAFDNEDTNGRNQSDVGSWCGIFTVYCYRMAGLHVSPWSVNGGVSSSGPNAEFRQLGYTETPQRGDLGKLVKKNHHFLVDRMDGGNVLSIDGNVDEPGVGRSVLSTRSRSLSTLRTEGAQFFTPIWERVLPGAKA